MNKIYRINEIFYSLQGEGMRCGEPSIFIRFSGCNLKCSIEPGEKSPGGFDCDTEFVSGRNCTLPEIKEWTEVMLCGQNCKWIVLTGGEPGLQVDEELIRYLHTAGFKLAIETNGSVKLPNNLDWITVSPKVAEHAIKQDNADEVKYVRGYGQAIPRTVVAAEYKLISPAFNGTTLDSKTLDWCIRLCLENPEWRLSPQLHKLWQVR